MIISRMPGASDPHEWLRSAVAMCDAIIDGGISGAAPLEWVFF